VKTFFKIVLVLLILFICGVLADICAGVIAALAAVLLHAGPVAVTIIVRIFATVFFCGFVLLSWVIYSRRRDRKLRRKSPPIGNPSR